jgi:hypothetical protein
MYSSHVGHECEADLRLSHVEAGGRDCSPSVSTRTPDPHAHCTSAPNHVDLEAK